MASSLQLLGPETSRFQATSQSEQTYYHPSAKLLLDSICRDPTQWIELTIAEVDYMVNAILTVLDGGGGYAVGRREACEGHGCFRVTREQLLCKHQIFRPVAVLFNSQRNGMIPWRSCRPKLGPPTTRATCL